MQKTLLCVIAEKVLKKLLCDPNYRRRYEEAGYFKPSWFLENDDFVEDIVREYKRRGLKGDRRAVRGAITRAVHAHSENEKRPYIRCNKCGKRYFREVRPKLKATHTAECEFEVRENVSVECDHLE